MWNENIESKKVQIAMFVEHFFKAFIQLSNKGDRSPKSGRK